MIFAPINIQASTICIPIFQATLRPQVKLYTLLLRFFIAHRFSKLTKNVNFMPYVGVVCTASVLMRRSLAHYVLLPGAMQ